jgi:transposase
MKTQVEQPRAVRARYDEAYKVAALERWRASKRSAATVAAELGIRAPLLYRWARTRRVTLPREGDAPSPKTPPPGIEAPPGVEALAEENRRLRAENEKLLEQREVLKKSLGILCEAPPRGMPKSNA